MGGGGDGDGGTGGAGDTFMMFWIVVDGGGGEVADDSGALGMSERINWKMPKIARIAAVAPPSPARIVKSLSDHEA